MVGLYFLPIFLLCFTRLSSCNGIVLSNSEIQRAILQLQIDAGVRMEEFARLKADYEKLKADYGALENSLHDTAVPLGFVYTQLPGQPSPYEIWPTMTWTDISSEYAGDFFRVVGGQSAGFGETQGSSFPRISGVETVAWSGDDLQWFFDIPSSDWSPILLTGDLSGNQDIGIKFHVQDNENRPVNKAIRLWRRNG